MCRTARGCLSGRYSALTRRCVGALLFVSELQAGERLRLAGFSSGTGVGARGGLAARRGRLCCGVLRSPYACQYGCYWNVLRSVHACHAFLLRRFAFGSRQSCNFYCRVLRSVHANLAISIAASCVRPRLSLFLRQEKRDGLRDVPFLFRVGRDRLSAFS